jgi:hypothetical protein
MKNGTVLKYLNVLGPARWRTSVECLVGNLPYLQISIYLLFHRSWKLLKAWLFSTPRILFTVIYGG